ncbi:unnamed protein product (mitochondrion) [Plasmodiophora brassicae]|uniref:Globin-sensor domain-containing protein n=1 Tax=Plasmodiophora brassicae TaxID=37360 RepID=A0A0G4J2Q2_PLABS|nr:hypothetical protein PBRA_008541 [Plasmodiophora brassicae]SPR01769.1 unnamed protein product [Plasmodiophora brassicae]
MTNTTTTTATATKKGDTRPAAWKAGAEGHTDALERVERDRLYTDLAYRYSYVCRFVEFGDADQKAIRDAAPHLGPLVPKLVDAVYDKLFSFDITRDIFATRMEGYKGRTILAGNDLSMDRCVKAGCPARIVILVTSVRSCSEQIRFRKDMLSKYLVKVVTADYNESMLKYLDWVAVIHTPNKFKKTANRIEYIHINALLTFVESVLIAEISNLPLDPSATRDLIVAFNKLLWVQNDLFAQYYVHDGNELAGCRAVVKGVPPAVALHNAQASPWMSSSVLGAVVLSLVTGTVIGYLAGASW